MAIDFESASSEFLRAPTAVVTDFPCTMSAWFNADNITAGHGLVGIFNSSSTEERIMLSARGDQDGDPIHMTHQSDTFTFAETSSGYTAGNLHHAAGVVRGASDRSVWLDGGSRGDNTGTTEAVQGANRTTIGRWDDSTPLFDADASIMECAVWNIDVTEPEIIALSKGYSPLLVRPQNLVLYLKLVRDVYVDLINGLVFTANGTPTVVPHSGFIYPTQPISGFAAAAEVGGVTVPIFDRYYRSMRAA